MKKIQFMFFVVTLLGSTTGALRAEKSVSTNERESNLTKIELFLKNPVVKEYFENQGKSPEEMISRINDFSDTKIKILADTIPDNLIMAQKTKSSKKTSEEELTRAGTEYIKSATTFNYVLIILIAASIVVPLIILLAI